MAGSNKRRRAAPSPSEAAALLEELAGRIEAGERDFELQIPLSSAMEALLAQGDVKGVGVLNTLALRLLKLQPASPRYPWVQERMDDLPDVDGVADGAALRAMARALREAGPARDAEEAP